MGAASFRRPHVGYRFDKVGEGDGQSGNGHRLATAVDKKLCARIVNRLPW